MEAIGQSLPIGTGTIVTPTRCLCRYFGNEPEFWLNLQRRYDLAQARETKGAQIEREVEVAD